MYEFKISCKQRVLDPEEGQQKLAELNAALNNISPATGAGMFQTRIDGVNLHVNPFPAWIDGVFKKCLPGVKFDDVNWAYCIRDEEESPLRKHETWFHQVFIPWVKTQPDATKMSAFTDTLVINVTDMCLEDLTGLSGF